MSIINKIKEFFRNTAGTPVTSVNLSSATISHEGNNQTSFVRNPSNVDRVSLETKIFRYIVRAIRFISRFFSGAIVLVVLANFAPELREELPSLYRFVDLLLVWLEWIFVQFWQIIEKVF